LSQFVTNYNTFLFDQWRGKYFWTGGARPIAPKSGTRNKGLELELERFLSRKQRSPKKRSSPDLERFLVPKMGSGDKFQGGGGQKSLMGAKISPGEAAAPLLPTPMHLTVKVGKLLD